MNDENFVAFLVTKNLKGTFCHYRGMIYSRFSDRKGVDELKWLVFLLKICNKFHQTSSVLFHLLPLLFVHEIKIYLFNVIMISTFESILLY